MRGRGRDRPPAGAGAPPPPAAAAGAPPPGAPADPGPPASRLDSPRLEFARGILALLRRGSAPWSEPWRPEGAAPPFNPVSGSVYRGINKVSLLAGGRGDPRWMSFRQLYERGWGLRGGARPSVIEFWQWAELVTLRGPDGRALLDPSGRPARAEVRLTRPRVRYYHVSNLGDALDAEGRGLPPYSPGPPRWDPEAAADELLAASGAVIVHDQSGRAFYSASRDAIFVPPRGGFTDDAEYYSTLLHELAHWTRHGDRLGRRMLPGDRLDYAREELRAEIASWMLGVELGLRYRLANHASYLGAWMKVIGDNPHELSLAAADAEAIKGYLLGFLPGFRPDYRDGLLGPAPGERPVEVSGPEGRGGPAEGDGPAVRNGTREGNAPAEGSVPAGGNAPAEGSGPAGGNAPAGGNVPVEGNSLVERSSFEGWIGPREDNVLAEGNAPEGREGPDDGDWPAKGNGPAGRSGFEGRSAPREVSMHAEGSAPAGREGPGDGDCPAEVNGPAGGDCPAEVNGPAGGECPAEVNGPAGGECPAEVNGPAG
ncbi:MAG: ssDNA-binding domain-containing protein, partial [Deltaproteobacteria bacterium]|nr:ssDNA-binding domain-containing protein [Deltaproteobacteria bacterium]